MVGRIDFTFDDEQEPRPQPVTKAPVAPRPALQLPHTAPAPLRQPPRGSNPLVHFRRDRLQPPTA